MTAPTVTGARELLAMPQSILVLTHDSHTASAVRSCFSTGGQRPHFCEQFSDFVTALEVAAPDIALIDIDPDPKHSLNDLEPVIAQYGRTRFVVPAAHANQDLLLSAMQAGARHFVLKDAIARELPDVVRRLAKTTAALTQLGSMITVLSAAGGCGATLLAVNLADELQLATETQALVIDLDLSYGAIGSYLGLDGDYGVADVLSYRDRIDPQLIQSTAMRFSNRLHALLSPATVSFSRPGEVRYERLTDLTMACRQSYPWTIVDAPRVPLDIAAELASTSRLTLIACQLGVKDLRTARAIRQALIDRGADVSNIQYAVCRYSRHGRLVNLDEARGVLDGTPMCLLSNDFAAAADSTNYGRLLSRSAPRSKLRRDIQTLAQSVLNNTRSAPGLSGGSAFGAFGSSASSEGSGNNGGLGGSGDSGGSGGFVKR